MSNQYPDSSPNICTDLFKRMRGLVEESVHSAVISLENRIQALNDQRTNPKLSAQAIARLDAEIENAERALAHFRAALRHEQQLLEAQDEPGNE